MKNRCISPLRRFSLPHVLLVHALVVLVALPQGPLMADMLTNNVLGGGGASAGTPAATAPAAGNSVDTAAATAAAHANAQDMLTRNTLAIQAVTAMQEAARAAAGGMNNAGTNPNFPGQTLPDVPNGLGVGGLDYISGTGATAPTSAVDSQNNIRTIVTIQQQQQQAMLEWKTFNVGRDTTLQFDQSAGGADAGSWIAFNRVTDPSGNPSQILGSIQAQGQVYVINQNGIIFGGASVVNTHTLVASALPINENLIARGLLNNPDSQFLFSANPMDAGTNGPTPAYTPPSVPAFGRIGNVTVQAGARITAPTSSANVGGRVALIGPNVTNEGTISTPDGQTILAAGMQVGFDAHSADDPSLRGLDVFVGAVGSYGGTATNTGLIEAPRGSVVITGKNVNQDGFINSTTSAALNGRVDLLANYNAVPNINYGQDGQGGPFVYSSGNSTGIVRTGANSVIQILPEYGSSLKVVGTELALKSQVNMQGLAIYLGTGSVVMAPNADVVLSAGVWDLLSFVGVTDLDFVHSSGQVYFDQGAVVNVAGSTAVASSISQYILTVDLRAAELADVPLQRNGDLRGQTVTVDMRQRGIRSDGSEWVGTPLANLTGYLGVIERTVGELTTAGGTVSINAGDSVVMQDGSRIDVAGGYQDFGVAQVATTRLMVGGNVVDIAHADPNVVYDGIYGVGSSVTDPRWGTSTNITAPLAGNGHQEAAHSYGGDGGSISIAAAAMALDGSLKGGTVIGPQQLDLAPRQSTLSLAWEAQLLSRAPLQFPAYSPTPPDIEFRSGASGLPAAGAFALDGSGAPLKLRQERRDSVILSPELLSTAGFGSLLVKNVDGDILVPTNVALVAPAAGTISLTGANVTVLGSISAPAGTIALTAHNISPITAALLAAQGATAVVPPADPTRGRVILGSAASLSTAGIIINDRSDAATPLSVPHRIAVGENSSVDVTHGGSIAIHAYIAELAAGSVLDVSGGLVAAKTITYGDAGSLSIKAGNDSLIGSVLGGHLSLGSTLLGYSGATGGVLALQATTLQVGGTATFPDTLLLQPEFFSTGGFSRFTLTGLGSDITQPGGAETFAPGIVIAPGAIIRPVVQQLLADVVHAGGESRIVTNIITMREGYRNTAVLNFEAPGVRKFADPQQIAVRGSIVMGAGARIETDALGAVTLSGQTVQMLGEIITPGGMVKIQGAGHYPENFGSTVSRITVHLGAGSRVSTAGKTVLLDDVFNRRVGFVHGGGSIEIAGNIVAEAGAVLDVSGTSSVLDLLPAQAGREESSYNAVSQMLIPAASVPVRVDSNGGSIVLQGSELLFSQATLTGLAGGADARGGLLSVSSGRFVPPGGTTDDKDINLIVAQDMAAFAAPFAAGQEFIGTTPVTSTGVAITGQGYFGANTFLNGGFDSLRLAGNVAFRGPVNVTARGYLQVADQGVLSADDLVRLTAPYVALGRPLIKPTRDEELVNPFQIQVPGLGDFPSYFGPSFGTGRLEVTAELIETGFLSLQNIGQATLTARQEMRGNGYFDIAGHLTLTAGQIYPVSASTFTITAYDYVEGGTVKSGSVTVASSGVTPAFPLSAGGRLSIFASTINQGGALRAPFGSIILGWDGTGTAPKGLVTNASVPVTQQLTMQSGGITSVSAIDPNTGEGVVIPYGIIKDGTNWIDPTGLDITTTGAPEKVLRLSAQNVTTEAGSTLDIRGGGELYGYRWVQGNGGTKDLLASDGSFAILPGYSSAFAPFAPYASTGLNAGNLGGDAGYVNSLLGVGDQIYLKGNGLVAAGVYTLLPARYALLPGAFLVTPTAGTPTDSFIKPGGPAQTTGYRFNSLNPAVTSRVYESFEVAAQGVVKVRAEYTDYSAQSFMSAAQERLGLPISRGPLDAGYALIGAQQSMQLAGNVSAAGMLTGRGGRVDISSPLDIVLGGPDIPAQAGKLVLNTSLLSGWNAESLLIGGERSLGAGDVTITTRTNNLTLDNAGSIFSGTDITLVAKETLTLAAGSSIAQTGTQTAADTFVVSGNGTLVRVSGVAGAQTVRTGVTVSALPHLIVGAGASVLGASITLDSTSTTTLNPAAVLGGNAVNLNSGRLSILLEEPGALQPNAGLVLGGTLLDDLQDSTALSLLSYSSIDIYGKGDYAFEGSLALRAAEIRGFNNGGETVGITATNLLLDNSANGSVASVPGAMTGALSLTADTIAIGQNALVVNHYATVTLNASGGAKSGGIVMQGSGSFRAQGALNAVTPFFSAGSNAAQTLAAGGALTLTKPAGEQASPTVLGLGAQVSFEGASVTAATDILLPSGLISLRALAGDVNVSGNLDAGGVAQRFFDTVRYTDAGQVTLTSVGGNVNLLSDGLINLAAAAGGGDAGLLVINAAGTLNLDGVLSGKGGTGGSMASAEIDVGSLTSFSALNGRLNDGFFTEGRNLRVRSGDVTIDVTVNAHRFLLGVDQGSITVNGTINAAGQTGGRIDLIAAGSVVVNSGAVLTVAGEKFDNAGKGGSVRLEAGAYVNGASSSSAVLDLRTGSTINLSVAENNVGSASRGQFTGTLHLRAPQSAGNTEVTAIQAIGAAIHGASSIMVEGYRVYDLTGSGVIDTAVQTSINNNGVSFGGNSAAISSRLLAGRADDLSSVLVVMPGAEIVNRSGNLTLGTATSAVAADWNLATFRYGPKNAPGVLTLRAAGNLEFYNTLSDGFNVLTAAPAGYTLVERMWLATLMNQNTSLPVNTQSWSYRMAAGADFSAVNFREVVPLSNLAANSGSLLLGKDAGQAIPSAAGANSAMGETALTRLAINPSNGSNVNTTSNRFQVIRTGTGDIEIFTGRDVQLLNQFATIYTAGVSVPSITTVFAAGDFVRPNVNPAVTSTPAQGAALGNVQQLYAAQYSLAGGNVTVSAQSDIVHLTKDSLGNLVADSSRQLPTNWLMRRGYVDPVTGRYGTVQTQESATRRVTDTAASTSWWIDFSNFFDGIATLGGGNVTLTAGRDVQNVSAHAATNARAAMGLPSAENLLELGGGDVTVTAGRNIDGGVYYVERGNGVLHAGGAITTNATRSPSLNRLSGGIDVLPQDTWLPTTLFVGKSSFDVSARGDVLLGPVANAFLMPQGLNNKHWYKTWFSTYAEGSGVTATSLGGDVTFRQAATLPLTTQPDPLLYLWLANEMVLNSTSASQYHPWLRLVETDVTPFRTLTTLMPGTLRAVAYSGSINLVGTMNLSPSATGSLELLAAGALNGLQPTGISSALIPGSETAAWASATVNLSDASPTAIPGVLSPYAYFSVVGNSNQAARLTNDSFLLNVSSVFAESGSTTGTYASTQVKQKLHANLLHAGDLEPVRIYAAGGDISGLTLFAGKAASILAQRDITDIGLYIQNLRQSDLTIVSAGRDIVAYNANSALRAQAIATGNFTAVGEIPKSGDIQISGPGTLQVLAGRDLNLGTGSNNSDGTGVGITSIGNGRNPYLPFGGADVIVAAGMGGASPGLGGSAGQFHAFISALLTSLNPPNAGSPPAYRFDTRRYFAELAEMLQKSGLGNLPTSILVHDAEGPVVQFGENIVLTNPQIISGPIVPGGPEPVPEGTYANSINLNDPALTAEQRNQLGLALYFLALRDAGRDRNNPDSPDVNTYAAGYEAIMKLFSVPDVKDVDGNVVTEGIDLLKERERPIANYVFSGNIETQGRDIRTKSGGSISILAPGGGLQLAATLIGSPLAPPGIITESGGNISIFADQDVSIGIARIFTLRGGDINIWSTAGDIAAGSSSKTVQSAPPTRVLIDPQSANVATDLAGLATGGGIGVLATVAGVAPANVDLIAPIGAVDAGDAGIRATGNLNIAAAVVLNAGNIVAGGATAGTPSAAVASPALGSLASAAAAGAASNAATTEAAAREKPAQNAPEETPSTFTVEVIGYGGGTVDDEEERKRKRNQPGE